MLLTLGAYMTFGLLLFFFGLLFGYYWTVLRKCKGFPVYNMIPYIIHYQMTRKKDVPFTNFLFQMLGDMYKKFKNEGLCMAPSLSPDLFLLSEEPIKIDFSQIQYFLVKIEESNKRIFLNEKAATNKSTHYKILADSIGHGLITSNGERWKKHKKLISPAFQLGMLKQKVPLFNDHALALIEDLKTLGDKPSSSYLSIIKRHYFNALSESIFGLKESKENEAELVKYFQAIDNSTMTTMYIAFQPWLWPKFALRLLSSGNKFLRMYDDMHNFARNVTLQMKQHVALNKESESTEYFSKHLNKSLSYLLLQHHLKDPSFTFEDFQAEVNTFMVAGFKTVSYTTMWCLFMLGLYPEIQEKVLEEVECCNYAMFEDMNSFVYLEAVIMETLRLYPTVPLIARSLSEDVHLGKYKVHKGTNIGFPIYYWHRNPDNFPDPEKFDPERFLTETKMKPWQFFPFAEGPRVCLGKKYALIEMKIFLAHILRNFKITSPDKREAIQLCNNTVLMPATPIRMLFQPRSNTLSM